MQQKVEVLLPESKFKFESELPKVVKCKKAYFNTEYGIPSTKVFVPSSPEYDSRYVYISRYVRFQKWTFNSKWGNRFNIGKDGTREEVIQKFDVWILTQPELLDDVQELKGKILCCWCKPEACHGDVLVELLRQQLFKNK